MSKNAGRDRRLYVDDMLRHIEKVQGVVCGTERWYSTDQCLGSKPSHGLGLTVIS